VFCARIADHPKPWFRYIPLAPGLRPQTDETGQIIVIDDTLTCLAHADPGGADTPSLFDGGEASLASYDAAFDAWAAARTHIHTGWMYNADPANLTRPVPKVMRDAADLIRAHGAHLADRQDDLIARLEAPYAPRIQRAVRDLLNDATLAEREKASQLLALADHLGLIRQPAPEPLPPIDPDDIHLICWTVILPAGAVVPENADRLNRSRRSLRRRGNQGGSIASARRPRHELTRSAGIEPLREHALGCVQDIASRLTRQSPLAGYGEDAELDLPAETRSPESPRHYLADGGRRGFPGENATGFRFRCEADHIDYWLRRGRPVVLICVNLREQRAWWKRLDTWFADPARRARCMVDFDKAADAFDVSAFTLLAAIATPAGEALPRLEGSEQLVSNLLAVTGFAPQIWSASTPCRDRADAWERMRSNRAFESGFHLSGGRIHTLASLEDGPLAVLCDGPVTSVPTAEWSDAQDDDVQRRFTALLNFTLRAAHHDELVWHPKKKIVYYQASADLSKRKVRGRYKGSKGRAFFTPYHGKDDATKVRYCRHYAAGLHFQRWAGQWYLEINPTYHFTIDGRRDSYYDAEYVAKIKRMERNSAVYQLVRAWADYLHGEDTLFRRRDERILFGSLLTVETDAAIDEKAWVPPPDPPAPAPGDSGVLAGLWDLPA
jgi:hypothetical protein